MNRVRLPFQVLLAAVGAALLLLAPAPVPAQTAALPANRGFATIQEMIGQSCAECHSWTGSHREIADPDRVTPGRPEESTLYVLVESDQMPLEGPKWTPGQKLLLRTWIEQGATASEEPLAADGALPAAPDAETGATPAEDASAAPARPSRLARTVRFHQISGFTSAGLLLGAGVVGTAKILTFMSDGHDFREANDIDEWETPLCRNEFEAIWNSRTQQTLRWTHVGLLVAGNGLYLSNAITGFGFPKDPRPGLTPRRIHRYAFYTHAALMAANVVLGFLTTNVLENGTHEQMIGLAAAHAAVGVAVPAVMITAGILINNSR